MTPEWAGLAAAFETKVIRAATKQIGAPYVWKGKGDCAFDAVKGLRPWGYSEVAGGRKAFDCSGLVTWALREASGIDVRGKWSADAIWQATQPYRNGPALFRWLKFYDTPKVTHIAIEERARGGYPLQGLVLEAGGAGADCTSEALALQKGACVRVVRDTRTDGVGSVPLWALGVVAGALSVPPVSP